jgi:hypothetical protein
MIFVIHNIADYALIRLPVNPNTTVINRTNHFKRSTRLLHYLLFEKSRFQNNQYL